MRTLILLVCLTFSLPVLAEEEGIELGWSQWSVPRSAETVMAMLPLQEAMRQLQAGANRRLVIHYPGGDEGNLWAVELRGWLVSLGLASHRISLLPGSQYPDRLRLYVATPEQQPALGYAQ